MRIAQIHTNHDWGGGEYQILNLCKGLQARNVSTVLFAGQDGALFKRAQDAGVNVRALPRMASGGPLWLGRASLCRAVSKVGVDLLHVHDSKGLDLAGAVGRRLNIPVLLSRRVASPLRKNFRSRRKYSIHNVSAVIAISEAVRSVMTACGYPDERIHVVQSGLDVEKLKSLEVDRAWRDSFGVRHIVGGIGRLSVKKNWQMLLRTAAQMNGFEDSIHWVILGEGPERSRLEQLAEELGIAEKVTFAGFRKDAAQLLKSFDLLFFPSLIEGASVTVREAMALGVPVVAVNNPGTAESLDGHGWLIEPDDIQAAVDCVKEALTNEAKRERICAEAIRSAYDRFSIDGTVDGTIAVYKKELLRGDCG